MAQDGSKVMAKKNKKGMRLHKWIATGGKPADYEKANKK